MLVSLPSSHGDEFILEGLRCALIWTRQVFTSHPFISSRVAQVNPKLVLSACQVILSSMHVIAPAHLELHGPSF